MIRELLDLDARYSRRINLSDQPGWLRRSMAFFAHSGDSWFWLLGLAVVWLAGSEYWKERALIWGAGILITAVLVLLIKFSVRRSRPQGDWGAIYRSTDPHSFPSGHAARSALIAILGLGLDPAWLSVLLLAWAPLVPLARVAMGVHYLSDVIAGAVFGILMGLLLLRFVPWM